MPSNVTEISGATQVDFYLGNYAYSDIAASMANLKFKLATDLNKIFYKNAAGTLYKFMNDASGSSNIPADRVLFSDSVGAVDSAANLTFDGTWLKIPGYLGRYGVSDDYIYLGNDTTTIHVGGVDAAYFETARVYIPKGVVIGDDAALSNQLLYVVKSQDSATIAEIRNANSGSSASTLFKVKSQNAEAILGSYSSTYSAVTEWQSKAVLSSTGYELALVGTATNGVEIYSGGTASGNKAARFMNSYTRFLKGLMIGDDSDPVGVWLHVKSPNEAAKLERTTISVTNAVMGLLVLKVTNTSGATTDGFGGGFRFDYQDTATSGYITEIQGVRNGTGGDLVFACSTTGSDMQKYVWIKSSGAVLFNTDTAYSETNYPWEFRNDRNGTTGVLCRNNDTGANASARFWLVNNAIQAGMSIYTAASSYTAEANRLFIYSNTNADGISISAWAGDIEFYLGNYTTGAGVNPRMILKHFDLTETSVQIGIGTSDPMLNIGSTSGDFSNASGIHIKADVSNTRQAFLALEGKETGSGEAAARIILACTGSPSNLKLMEIRYVHGQCIQFHTLNDDTTDKHEVMRLSASEVLINYNTEDVDFIVRGQTYDICQTDAVDHKFIVNPSSTDTVDFESLTNTKSGILIDASADRVLSEAIADYNIYGESDLKPVYISTSSHRMGQYSPP